MSCLVLGWPEPRSACDELHVPRIAELEGKPHHVPIERRRHIHIAEVEDQIADALHGPPSNHRCPHTEKLRELKDSVAIIVVPGSRRPCSC